ncbi:PREDICTED: uncharacterized serine-rich protein C215.13-like, partial [Rhagoletis zephyria]|uniref:uncharacterized serine-rich protein C215.13-like n=1 Tax=Rhagoletis zephyria TaxID=28612 RepID=UPI000811607B
MSQPQQQQLQQQSKITAFFTSRNSVLADEDKSLVAVKDAKSSKLQTFPPAKLPKTDAQHVTADGTKKKRQRKVTQPSDNKDKRLTPPLLPSSPTTAELVTFSQKTRSSSRLNRTGDRDLAAFESTLQSETLTLSTITSTLDEPANCQSSSAASELATAPKKRGRKKRKLDIDATESPQHQQLQHLSEMPKSDNENKGANHDDDDGKNQPESENTNGTNSTTFKKKKGNDKNEMNAENLVAADVADSITTTTEMTLKSTASLQHQLTSSDDKLKQFSSSSSSSSSSSHSQSAQWPSMASFYGSLDHQKTATKAGVTSSSTLVIAASATTTTTTYQQTAQTTQPQPAALIKTGGKLLLTPKSLPSSTVDRLRTKLAEAAASQFSEAVQEDAVVVAESNTAKDDDDDSATEIDEPEKS